MQKDQTQAKHTHGKKKTALSVIVPCFNEEKNILPLVERIEKLFRLMEIPGEIVLVDDGSIDDTAQKIMAISKEHPNVHALFHTKNLGIEAVWKTALPEVQTPLICLIDADFQYIPENIWHLYDAYMFHNVDLMRGARIPMHGGFHGWYVWNSYVNFLLNMCLGTHGKDNLSGFIITRKDVLVDILEHKRSYFYFQILLSVAAHARGYSTTSLDILFDHRHAGTSIFQKQRISIAIRTFADIFKAFLEYRIGKQNISPLEIFLKHRAPRARKLDWSPLRYWYFKLYLFLMPLHHWMITGGVGKKFILLHNSQWLSQQEIERYQTMRLRALMTHAYHHVPYWRKVFEDADLTPDDIASIKDLRKLPLFEKKTIRERVHIDLTSNNHRKKDILRISTSGSTGEPLICYADREQLEVRWAATLRGQEWTGYRFGDRCLRLWHQTIGMSKSQIVREYIDAFMTRRKFIPAYHIDEQNIRQFLREIQRHRPVLIDGYAESFNLLSLYVKNSKLATAQPRGIMTSAQTLPLQSRKTIEEAFGCKVYDKYGSREFSGIAYECNSGNHHIVAESYIVELLTENGIPAKPGEIGEVVVTDLNNYCMPFIRYRIGDLARAAEGQCPCGRGLPILGAIEGRTQAIIIGMQKQYVPGTFFAHFFKEYDYAIRQYQVVQEERGSLILKIVKTNRFTDEILCGVIDALQEYVGPDMKFQIEFLEQIPLSRTGKIQGSISRLPIDFQHKT